MCSGFSIKRKNEVFIYRYPEIDTEIIRERAERYLGCECNHSYCPDNGKFYCSQYIAEVLPIYDIVPMKFGDGKNERLTPIKFEVMKGGYGGNIY